MEYLWSSLPGNSDKRIKDCEEKKGWNVRKPRWPIHSGAGAGHLPLGKSSHLMARRRTCQKSQTTIFLARFLDINISTITNDSTYITVSVNICNTIKHSHHYFWNKWWRGFLADFVMIANSFYGSSTRHFCVWIFWLCGIESFLKFEASLRSTKHKWNDARSRPFAPYFCQIFLLQIIVFGLFVQRISFLDLFIFSCLLLLPSSEPGKLLGEFLIKKFPHRPGVPPAFNVILDRGNQLDFIHFFLSTYIKCF